MICPPPKKKNAQVVVVLDDEDRENEGDLVMAADMATPAALHFIVRHSSGVVCVGMEVRCDFAFC